MRGRSKLSKFRGRSGRQGRVDREGQAWSQDKAYVVGEDLLGNPIAPLLPIGHFTCKVCGYVVEMDHREKAFCTGCGAVYNEGASWFPKKKSLQRETKWATKHFLKKISTSA